MSTTIEHPAPSKPATTLPRLLPHHLAKLRASGLTDATIKASGIYSETVYAKRPRFRIDPSDLADFLESRRVQPPVKRGRRPRVVTTYPQIYPET